MGRTDDIVARMRELSIKTPSISKDEWITRYGGQEILDAEGFDVVRCYRCDDPICHGWRVIRPHEDTARRVLSQVGSSLLDSDPEAEARCQKALVSMLEKGGAK